ncbi:mitochondrial carnitine/acylcarnitine carrier-like protein [Tanacetum coccineum]
MQLILGFRLQAQGSSADSGVVADSGVAVTTAVKYGGPMDAAKQVLRTDKRVRSLFKGLFPTLTRGASADCRPKFTPLCHENTRAKASCCTDAELIFDDDTRRWSELVTNVYIGGLGVNWSCFSRCGKMSGVGIENLFGLKRALE